MAVDLIMFPKSTMGNVAALVTVDHYSKWLAVVPIKDKRSITVSNALRFKILPCLPRIPDRILSDNGGEFVAPQFEELLQEHNIKHIYSTPYCPSSNGACERVNKTLTEFLKGLTAQEE